jgi:hypothetical protein
VAAGVGPPWTRPSRMRQAPRSWPMPAPPRSWARPAARGAARPGTLAVRVSGIPARSFEGSARRWRAMQFLAAPRCVSREARRAFTRLVAGPAPCRTLVSVHREQPPSLRGASRVACPPTTRSASGSIGLATAPGSRVLASASTRVAPWRTPAAAPSFWEGISSVVAPEGGPLGDAQIVCLIACAEVAATAPSLITKTGSGVCFGPALCQSRAARRRGSVPSS